MSTHSLPAIQGTMGSLRYYQTVMRADQLSGVVGVAMDFEELRTAMVHENMQRAINEERVERTIVPYLTNSADRFFGSIIVLVYKPKVFEFEPLESLGTVELPKAYGYMLRQVGSLTIDGGKLFALDGQHRLHALRTVIAHTVTPRLGLKIDGPFREEVKSDMLSVIFLEFTDTETARRIFNKVNRYAKPTTTSTNILTSEDDGIYIITRCIASLDDPRKFDSTVDPPIPLRNRLGDEVVQLEGSSIKGGSRALFTLELLSKSVDAICTATGQPPLDEASTIVRPTDDVLRSGYEVCAKWWSSLMEGFVPFADATENPNVLAGGRAHGDRHSIAYRPNGQEALIRGMMQAHSLTGLDADRLVELMNELPLSFYDDEWLGILLSVGEQRNRVIGYTALASDLVAYMLVGPGPFGARRQAELLSAYIDAKSRVGIPRKVLPKPVV